MSTTAIIIARGGSERIPNKNLRTFHPTMQPLIAHKVSQLLKCKAINRVVVGSDSPEILACATQAGAEVRRRLPEFCDEKTRPWNDVIVDMVSMVPGDIIVWAHCTNPCIQPRTYDRAVAKYYEDVGDSVVSVHAVQTHAWFDGRPLNFDPHTRPHRVARQLQPVLFQNGGIFVAPKKDILQWGFVYGPEPALMEIDQDEATDIDTERDWMLAESAYGLVAAKHRAGTL